MSNHSAAGPALGYQYQADFGLLELARSRRPGAVISLEMHDDIAWEESGTPIELLQIKHQVNSTGGLGDKSVKLWKTLGVWMSASHVADVNGPDLHLVTNGTAAAGSAAYVLRSVDRDPAEALRLLLTAAAESETEDTATERKRFIDMAAPDRSVFISKVFVSDAAPNIIDIVAAVREELFHHLPRDPAKTDLFIEQLFGWWRGRAVEMLSHRFFTDRDLRPLVRVRDLTDRLQSQTVQFSDEGLPEWAELVDDPEDHILEGFSDDVFVHQLNLLKYNHVGLRRAIIDFYRAVGSETRWVEHGFIEPDEVRKYELRLSGAWEAAWGNIVSALAEDATDEDKRQIGLELLTKVLASPIPLRSRDAGDQDYYYRGKHHMMASEQRIGWHPEFKERLEALLLEKTAS